MNTIAIETFAGIPYLFWIISGIVAVAFLLILVAYFINNREGCPK